MKQTKKLSVIILNWNGSRLLREFLPSVIANTRSPEVEVIVADNGSTDDSVKVMEEEFPGIRILRFEDNLGFSGGYNRAISEVESEFTVLLNSDVEAPEGWWQPLLAFM